MAVHTKIENSGPGFLPREPNSSTPIQTATQISTQDGAGTAVYSPKASVGTTPVLLTTPNNATTLTVYFSAAGRIGENATLDGSGTGKGYQVVPATTLVTIPCAYHSGIYVAAETGTITVYFHYELI